VIIFAQKDPQHKMKKNSQKFILLTGAGFTKDFGGFLADEMWSLIYNHKWIQERPHIQRMMVDSDFDYESVYHEVFYNPRGKYVDDHEAVRQVFIDAYNEQDRIICGAISEHWVTRIIPHLRQLINTTSHFFTLNQDIFIERQLEFLSKDKPLVLPGLMTKIQNQNPDNVLILPNELSDSDCNFSEDEIPYIKLHGSYTWYSSEGHERMIIGHNKPEQIGTEPLLKRYFKIFKKFLSQPETKLLIIGYGFRDEHINKEIHRAVKDNGLKLYIITPEKPREWALKLIQNPQHLNFKGVPSSILSAYYPYGLREFLEKRIYQNLL
jgi:hypothetical protein